MKKLSLLLMPLILFSACSTELQMQRLLGSRAESLLFYGCKSVPGGVSFSFSAPVSVDSAYFEPQIEIESVAEGETVTFYFRTDKPGGSKLTADVLVKDSKGNTLNVLIPFRTRNAEVPKLLISEVCTKNSNMSGDKPRTEFVELLVLSPGNLGALRLFAAGNNSGKGLESPIMEFPPAMVKSGEYIVIHARTLESQSGCKDETEPGIVSGGYEATPGRDFWIPGSAARIHNTDVIFIMDQDDMILDGVSLSANDEKKNDWKNDIVRAAKMLEEQGQWNGSDSSSAVSTTNASPTRTVNRKGSVDSNSAADWYVTVSSGATPGKANNPAVYK